ncbi:CvpA family protein [Lacticaseibacillus nasuensis]|uniref:CvpA family protein n=1 Tax=Lacticaseibacillus nasuensis TaxID=944671 RepID=UPI0022460551|nr:CvpA family protein [Lacticaseibacillus nasuensis]MCX2454427.1 CvpA family protein [Lacticaseibacillus nasuensis]
MLTLLIIAMLAYSFYAGARRGMWLQGVYLIGYLVSAMVAAMTYRGVAKTIALWIPYPSATEDSTFVFFTHAVGLTLDEAFYHGVAFIGIFALGWVVTRFVALWCHDLTYRRGDEQLSLAVGGVSNVVVGYFIIFLVLYLLALVPVGGIQQALAHSFAAKTIVRYTPGLTQLFTALWVTA